MPVPWRTIHKALAEIDKLKHTVPVTDLESLEDYERSLL